jgi:RNA-binding protein
MPHTLTNPEKRALKARAQRLEPVVKLGHAGITEAFLKSMDGALAMHELVKMKFADFKEEKKTLAPEIAERTQSELITLVGNVAVFFRPKPASLAESSS